MKGEGAFFTAVLPGRTRSLGTSGGEGVTGEALGQAPSRTSASPDPAMLDPQAPERKPTTA